MGTARQTDELIPWCFHVRIRFCIDEWDKVWGIKQFQTRRSLIWNSCINYLSQMLICNIEVMDSYSIMSDQFIIPWLPNVQKTVSLWFSYNSTWRLRTSRKTYVVNQENTVDLYVDVYYQLTLQGVTSLVPGRRGQEQYGGLLPPHSRERNICLELRA